MEYSEEYLKGFEDALTGALVCVGSCRNCGDPEWICKMMAELIEMMTPERHAEWLKRYEELNHRPYKREKYERIIGGRNRGTGYNPNAL